MGLWPLLAHAAAPMTSHRKKSGSKASQVLPKRRRSGQPTPTGGRERGRWSTARTVKRPWSLQSVSAH